MAQASADTFSLRQVANLTGLSEFTLRGWEGRYQAFVPDRTLTGRRQYSKDHLTRAMLLRELTDVGYRIGEIAQLSTPLLQKKIDETQAVLVASEVKVNVGVAAVLNCALVQNWIELKKVLAKSLHKQKPRSAVENIILPILSQIGKLVSSGRLGTAQEHILSALIKEQLYFMLLKTSAKQKGRQKSSVIIATPEGDFHEIGILIAHVIFASFGINSLFLGTNTPKKDLSETAIRMGATHVLIASTVNRSQGAKDDILSYVEYLDQHLPKSVMFWFGGRNLENMNLNLDRDFKYFNSLHELPKSIQEMTRMKKKRGQDAA